MAFAKNSFDMDRFAIILLCLVPVFAVGDAGHMPRKQVGNNGKLSVRNEFKPSANMSAAEASDEEIMETVKKCNATFPTPPEYLIQLNSTGRFPADASHDSKCYLLCILSSLKVADENGNLDTSNFGKLFTSEEEEFLKRDTVMKCLTEEMRNKDACEQAYERMSCIFREQIRESDGM